ncbi:zf-CCCH domain-containing protein [Cephalotus follicularis]|uniref:Zf-CCCH domain-containing protein n=1 Tax=Cephalotus follicularis TaxID=3775 RepID=A0A1Q3D8T9_CEPFO|nr:zf-CCCH domain-containing protein [Cephalotus follicularis]
MVAATPPPSLPQQQQQASTTSAGEEALKRNTDCVYFLASPLTCKKGSECEYRHSEYARINPRDCYFWLNGNCLNPKCGFRHPPLDGFLGTQAAPSSGSSLPSLQTPVTPATPGKPAVPCIFFQKGLCLKGDRCAFLHGPNSTSSKSSQVTAATTAIEPLSLKNIFGGLQRCAQERHIPVANVSKAVAMVTEAKACPIVETAPSRNNVGIQRNVPPPTVLSEEVPQYKATNVSSVVNGNSVNRSNRLYQANISDDYGLQNGKDADELLRESSPGFDVLVDDELGDSDYFHGEDEFGRTDGSEGRNLNSVDEYNIDVSADYNSMVDVDREMFRDPRGYDLYGHMQGHYGWEQHKSSTERMLVGPSNPERLYRKSESPDHIGESDLRYRLSKHRGTNGSRSVFSHDHASDNHVEEQNYRGSSRRDSHHIPQNDSHDSSLSRRLRGRIKLPVRSSVDDSDLCPERGIDRGRNRGRLSPGRPYALSQKGRLQERMKGRVEENYGEGMNLRGPRTRREIMDDRRIDFARPKRLAELKVKSVEITESNSHRKRKSLEDQQHSEGDLSFEGPMPLSEILKRKRKAETGDSGIGMASVINEENKYVAVVATEGTADDGGIAVEKTEGAHDPPSELPNTNDLGAADVMIGDDSLEDLQLDAHDQRDREYEYEQVDEGEYYEEAENADVEEEYLEEEDGDDFAKKIGVLFS